MVILKMLHMKMTQDMHLENNEVKEEFVETNVDEDYMYMKVLYHALPMKYATAMKLQHKLSGEANQNTVRKLLDRMAKDDYIKNIGHKRLGKLVVQSEASNKKLAEVKELLDGKSMGSRMLFSCKNHNMKDGSTYGGLHSIGSDLTRTRGQSEAHKSESIHSGQTYSGKAQEPPISSLECGIVGNKISQYKIKDLEKQANPLIGDLIRSFSVVERSFNTIYILV